MRMIPPGDNWRWLLTVRFGSHHVGAGFKFQCKGDQGAVLMMNHSADLEAIHGTPSLVKHLEANWGDWLDHISSGLDIQIPKKTCLMFIYGFRKTVDWAVASCISGAKSAEFSLSADAVAASTAFSFSVSSKTEMSAEHNWGPRGRERIQPSASTSSLEDVKKDQSVFIHFYAMKRRLKVFPPTIMKAAAGYHNLPAPDRDSDSELPPVDILQEVQTVDQLETDRDSPQVRCLLRDRAGYAIYRDSPVQ